MTAPPAIVFLGPTLRVAEARKFADALYLPPAAQGSIIQAVRRHRPRSLLIIDGVFQSEPAVRHKEILWALDQGVAVLGAASMGALRAAELHPFGMIGIGLIYRWYRRWTGAPDDAVAVVHAPPEVGAEPLTLALIDLLRTIKRAERRSALGPEEARHLEAAARRLNFRERLWSAVLAGTGIEPGRLVQHLVEQKKHDAISALRRLDKVNPRPPKGEFVWTTNFVRDLAHAKIALPDESSFPRALPDGRFAS